MAALFEYLGSQEFSTAITRIASRLTELRAGLARERSYHDGSSTKQSFAALARESSTVDASV